MTDKQIVCFITVAKELNFTLAGEKLFASQSTISRQINLLEEELGFDLFYRDRKSVRLTPAGLVMLKTFTEIQEIFDEQKQVAHFMNLGKTGELKIALVSSMEINSLWDDIIPKFKELYPNIILSCECYTFEDITEKLENCEVDLAFAHTSQHINSTRIEYDIAFHSNIVLVCAKNHPLAKKEVITGEDLKNELVWTVFSKESHDNLLKDIYHYYGIKQMTTKTVPNFSTAHVNVRMGNGILFIDPYTYKMNEEHYCLIPLPEEHSRVDFSVLWNKTNLNPSIPLLLELLSKEKK